MSKQAIRIGVVAASVGLVVVIAYQWRGQLEHHAHGTSHPTLSRVESAPSSARVSADGTQDSQPQPVAPSPATLTTEDADADLEHSVPSEQDLAELVGGIDPLLRERNLITRPRDLERKGPGLGDMELRFSTEGADANWSDRMEA